MTPNLEMAVHPAADALPSMSDAEFQQLKDDIRVNRLTEPIVLHNGAILDGRHRYRACLELGIEPVFRNYDGDDPVAFVISMNLCRRHLNTAQRALIAADLADLKRGGDRTKAQNCAFTHAKAAALLNVSERSVDAASALKNAVDTGRLDPSVSALVHKGAISLSRAAKVARLPKDQQSIAASQTGSRATTARRPPRKPFARQADDVVRGIENLCSEMEKITVKAAAARKLTTDLADRFIEACEIAADRLNSEIRCLQVRQQGLSSQSSLESSVAQD